MDEPKEKKRFPVQLHWLLEEISRGNLSHLDDVVGFQDHGRAFKVMDEGRFSTEILTIWFDQHDWHSFVTTLLGHGFRRLQQEGSDQGAFYHELFLRSKPELAARIYELEGWQATKPAPPEPDFSRYPNLGPPSRSESPPCLSFLPVPGAPTLAVASLADFLQGHNMNSAFGSGDQRSLEAFLSSIRNTDDGSRGSQVP